MRWLITLVLLTGMVVVAGNAQAQGLMAGDAAPAFELPGSDGKTHRLTDYAGKTVVLAWFPKAFTGG
jgi:peroxiredoxin Q/BCP